MESHGLSYWLGNAVSTSAVVASILGYAPALAATVALVWYFIQIYESETVRRWMADRRARRLARLKQQVAALEAQTKSSLPDPSPGAR